MGEILRKKKVKEDGKRKMFEAQSIEVLLRRFKFNFQLVADKSVSTLPTNQPTLVTCAMTNPPPLCQVRDEAQSRNVVLNLQGYALF
jgi:hypothetical protein